ncbi:HNH endonuclease [Streptomyces massasporeus]|uniref:HNH endonuclease n=1 Tax=Streptomyces massasporeus TaxID=67324 RepID=UPI00382D3535
MEGKRANALYCSRACKNRASEGRRDRDDGARYQAERERRIAYASAYAKTHPHVGQAARNRRKAWKREAGVFALSGKEWRRLCARQRGECPYCGERAQLTMDHVIPLAKGGRHSIGNVFPVCAPCNSSKSDSFLAAWKLRRRRG